MLLDPMKALVSEGFTLNKHTNSLV